MTVDTESTEPLGTERAVLRLDSRDRINLGPFAPTHRVYLGTRDPDGTIHLEPGVIMPAAELQARLKRYENPPESTDTSTPHAGPGAGEAPSALMPEPPAVDGPTE